MFWRFGGYANISTIDTILDKPDFTLEEVLDESDLIQELKQHNSKLIEYLRDESVLQRLLAYVIAPPLFTPEEEFVAGDSSDDESEQAPPPRTSFSPLRGLSGNSSGTADAARSPEQEERAEREEVEKTRQKYAYVASEILASETWSIVEALIENLPFLRQFWEFIRKEAPLDPATAGYFTKINETLLDKKTEEMLDLIKSLPNIVPAMLRHIDCPMILDLLLKIISMEKSEGGQGIVDWLQTQDLMPLLLAFLNDDSPTFTQTSAGDFIKAIITISANASQNEQSCIGPNSLTRQLVSEPCIESLIANMLKGGNPLTVGVGIIIEVIRKNNSDYDPEIQAGQELPPSTSDPIYLGTLLRLFAQHVPDFMELILSPNHTVLQGDSAVRVKRQSLVVASGKRIEPLGFDRFKTCELMAELLHCSNMGLLNEKGSEAYIQQRDHERERLRAAGALAASHEPQSAVTEFSEDGSSFETDAPESGSPRSSRRLEVTNSADDDGFEDVGRSEDIPNEAKTTAPPATSSAPANANQPTKGRLSLDEEFFDEPLTPQNNKGDTHASPTSPTAAVAAQVHQLNIAEVEVENEDKAPNHSTKDLVNAIDASLQPAQEADAGRLKPSEAHEGGLSTSPLAMSPNPNDTPAPLFSPRGDDAAENAADSAPLADDAGVAQPDDVAVPFVPHLENDIDGQPIVGDFLKRQFVDHRVVPTILDFFFRFPWNNFLHNVVYDVVQQVFNGPMDRGFNRHLAFDLFASGRITERIIEGQMRSDAEQARTRTRLGYMGHLTLLAEEVVKFSERYPPEVLSDVVLDRVTDRAWNEYVEVTLNETRERDNAILGGVKPDGTLGPRAAVLNAVNAAQGFNSGSAALASAGLGGSAGLDSMDLSHQPGFLAGGSLLSGFGSSSDEEDDDMDELRGDGGAGTGTGAGAGPDATGAEPEAARSAASAANTAAAATATAAAATHASSSALAALALAAPAPADSSASPAPLAIPPSRARRQLAARLALHAQSKAAAAAGGGAGDSQDSSGAASAGGTASLDALLASASRDDPSMAAAAALQHTDALAAERPRSSGDGGSDDWGRRDTPALDPAWAPRAADWVDFGGSSSETSSDEETAEVPRRGGSAHDNDAKSEEVPLGLAAEKSAAPPRPPPRTFAGRVSQLLSGSGTERGGDESAGTGSEDGETSSDDERRH